MMRGIFLLFLLFICLQSYGQKNIKDAEKELVKEYFSLLDWNFKQPKDNLSWYDSLEVANFRFARKLLNITKKFAASLHYPFDSLQEAGISIASSKDGQFRIYSWDTWTGGTMHFFENIFQFKNGKEVKSIQIANDDETDPRSWYSKIYSFKTNKSTIYIGVNHSVGSTRDKGGGIKLFTIENGKLNHKIKLIRTNSGLQNEIRFYFDMVQAGEGEWPEAGFDAKTKTILIPLIDENLKPTAGFIKYRWKGRYFQKLR